MEPGTDHIPVTEAGAYRKFSIQRLSKKKGSRYKENGDMVGLRGMERGSSDMVCREREKFRLALLVE